MRARFSAMAGQPTVRKIAAKRARPARTRATRTARRTPGFAAAAPCAGALSSSGSLRRAWIATLVARSRGGLAGPGPARSQERGELGGQRAAEVLGGGRNLADVLGAETAPGGVDALLHEDLGGGRARGQPQPPHVLEPLRPDVGGTLDQVRGDAVGPGDLAEAQRVRAV